MEAVEKKLEEVLTPKKTVKPPLAKPEPELESTVPDDESQEVLPVSSEPNE